MYNFYVIEGKKLINYKPGYEQYTRAFTRVEEELEQKAEGISLEQLKRLFPELFVRSLYLFIKYVPVAYEKVEKSNLEEEMIQYFWAFIESVSARIGCLTPQEFVRLFPITKEYDGEKYGMKDYFYTAQKIKAMSDEPIGEENVSEFLFNYCNRDIEEYMVTWMGIVNRLHMLNGGRDITLEFFEDIGMPVHTFHEEAGYMVNDETGERFKIKKSTKRARKLFSVVSD